MSSSGADTSTLTSPGIDRSDAEPRTANEVVHALWVFLTQRTRLLRIARRVTGDAHWAEDCVQETWLRWQLTDRSGITNPSAFLATTVTRLAINLVQAARNRHETPSASVFDDRVGIAQDPVASAEQDAVVAETLRMLMARLTPAELAAYVLRKGFDYAYSDIARLLQTSIPNARQLVCRGQDRIMRGRDRSVGAATHRHLVAAFLAAERNGDLSGLERLLTQFPRAPRFTAVPLDLCRAMRPTLSPAVRGKESPIRVPASHRSSCGGRVPSSMSVPTRPTSGSTTRSVASSASITAGDTSLVGPELTRARCRRPGATGSGASQR